jgi:hypothetical protein
MAIDDVVSKKVVEYEYRAVQGKQGPDVVEAMGGMFDKLGKRMLSANRRARTMNKQMGEARMRFAKFLGVALSTLFISKALAGAFKSLIDPVLEITGVFDVWRATLISVLAPVIIPLAMMLIKLMTIFMGMPKELKIVTGVLVVLGFVVFSIFGWLAQFALLFGALTMGAKGGAGVIALFKGGIAALGPILTTIAAVLMIAVAAFLGIWRIIEGFAKSDLWKIISGILIIVGMIIAAILGAPVLLIGAIGIIIAGIVYLADKVKWLQGVILAVVGTILTPFLILYDVIKGVIDLISGKGIDWKGATGKYWDTVGSKFSGPKMAAGGVVTSPTMAMIGENGPEAVVPLDQMGGSVININISGDFTGSGGPDRVASTIQSVLRDELRRLGVR